VKASASNLSDPLADKILRYLREHPEAGDTIDGIADWWLTERRVRQGIAEVEIALRHLVERGLVDVAVREDGKRHYCLKLEKQQDGRGRLNDSK
jgi:DNA-binding transcriptional ArsR family regulator